MSEELSAYAKYFQAGQRVGVSIPLPGDEVFRDWAVLKSVVEDLAELQLSRDILPHGAQVHVGAILELRTAINDNGYCCRSMVVSESPGRNLLVRFIGEVIYDELREYFRIDVYLPLQLSIPAGLTNAEAKAEWLETRRKRLEQKTQEVFLDEAGAGTEETVPEEDRSAWENVPPIAANISGGGLRVTIPEELKEDVLVNIELYLPLPAPMVIDVVGQVISADQIHFGDDPLYSTAIRFLYIDERDRDRIINYVSVEQLELLRRFRKGFLTMTPGEFALNARPALRTILARFLYTVLFFCVSAWLMFWLIDYHRDRPKSEIHKIFEQGLREYLNKYK
ncbi:MAG: PilZ domain [Geobacteraceae bacterium]|nr:MAG: PilZ domain [Geobacteraceae bacterium]